LGFRGALAATFALVILLAMLTVGFAYSELELETEAHFWVAHSHQVIEQNEFVLTLVQRAENSERTYLLSGDVRRLGGYSSAEASLPGAQADLARLVVDNPEERGRVAALNRAITWRAVQLRQSVELARSGDLAGAKAAALAQAPAGPSIRGLSDAVNAAERVLLEQRVRRAGAANGVSVAVGLGLAAVSLPALLGFVFYLASSNRRLVRALDETAQATAQRDAAEQRLREAHRMEAMGQLTGGVAHDFNNLLQVIRGNLELLEPRFGDAAADRRRLDNAIHATDRAAQLTRQLLAFARRQPLATQAIDVAKLVGDMTDILRRTLGEKIEVLTTIAPDLWPAMADPAQTESAILNLAINARDAMPGGGRLILEAANATLEPADALCAEGGAPGDYVQLTVSDTGEGMTPETRARAFEPFFTTKVDGKGSGLGLAMVYGFVHQSGGLMRLESQAGQGARVSLYLPRALQPAARETTTAAGAPSKPAHGAILIVEDDADVRLTAVTMLNTLGYHCLEAGDAASAVELVRSGEEVDLVFSDVVMPGAMKPREMVDTLRRLKPNIPILFTSGYPKDEIGRGGELDADVTLINKPYAREELAEKIARMLAGSGPKVRPV
jgi:signal transduction histidine kinase